MVKIVLEFLAQHNHKLVPIKVGPRRRLWQRREKQHSLCLPVDPEATTFDSIVEFLRKQGYIDQDERVEIGLLLTSEVRSGLPLGYRGVVDGDVLQVVLPDRKIALPERPAPPPPRIEIID